ncbi:MAG TPA: transcriptional repressor [Candidatus Enterenecus merdae]|nr:transcriptional repressor [Candidatus Enterenecus merdae]
MAIVRRSQKRDAILRLMRSTKCHPSADWIYQQLKEQYPNLSLGTVYRNLNQLSEQHIIRRVGVIQGQERFDADTYPHAHFVCNRCGTVMDLPDCAPSEQDIQALGKQYGFMVEGHEFNLRGLCQDCKHHITLEESAS